MLWQYPGRRQLTEIAQENGISDLGAHVEDVSVPMHLESMAPWLPIGPDALFLALWIGDLRRYRHEDPGGRICQARTRAFMARFPQSLRTPRRNH